MSDCASYLSEVLVYFIWLGVQGRFAAVDLRLAR